MNIISTYQFVIEILAIPRKRQHGSECIIELFFIHSCILTNSYNQQNSENTYLRIIQKHFDYVREFLPLHVLLHVGDILEILLSSHPDSSSHYSKQFTSIPWFLQIVSILQWKKQLHSLNHSYIVLSPARAKVIFCSIPIFHNHK